eukprot:SAG22_NODE_17646_length_301_cov_0.762376_1_plen_40_part_10
MDREGLKAVAAADVATTPTEDAKLEPRTFYAWPLLCLVPG